ncbi:MAG: transcription termination/antitermination protein NusG, partial [Firmicutes bacterium]|nr:transcription termination/antitermination protein NusG [Bacillota bacterium]
RVESMGMEDKIFRIVVPIEEELEVKDGKKKLVKRKVFPGYVMVQMILTDDSWYVVRNTPGVTGFVGSGTRPMPLLEDEVHMILGKDLSGTPDLPKTNLTVGQEVTVMEGPFEGFAGKIEEIFPDRGKVRLVVSMFGRDTPLEVDFGQVAALE